MIKYIIHDYLLPKSLLIELPTFLAICTIRGGGGGGGGGLNTFLALLKNLRTGLINGILGDGAETAP